MFTELRPRKDKRGFDLISDALPFGRLWYLEVRQAIDFAKHQSPSHDVVIHIYDAAGTRRDSMNRNVCKITADAESDQRTET